MYLEYEASHGTVTDLWLAHLRGEPTSLNPLVCLYTYAYILIF